MTELSVDAIFYTQQQALVGDIFSTDVEVVYIEKSGTKKGPLSLPDPPPPHNRINHVLSGMRLESKSYTYLIDKLD